jgi:hypothetical protein
MKVGRHAVAVETKAVLLLTAKPSMEQRLIEEAMQFGAVLHQHTEFRVYVGRNPSDSFPGWRTERCTDRFLRVG